MSRPIPIEEMVRAFKSRHTTSHLFKIDNFSLLTKYNVERIESSVFDLGGHKWKLVVYPNGNKVNGYVSMFLQNQNPIIFGLEVMIFVVSQLEQKWHPSSAKWNFHTQLASITKGLAKLISLDDLKAKGYLIEDCCMFGVKLPGLQDDTKGTAECFSLIEKPLNHKVTWLMTKFSSFDPENVHHSNEFVVGTRKWRIEVHPKGFMGDKDKSFSVYLSSNGFIENALKANTFAKFKLRVLDQDKRDHFEKPYSNWLGVETDAHHGFDDFMPLKKLHETYLVKDKLYVGVEFEVISMTTYC